MLKIDELKYFFKGKRILITGHTGFKGAWLSLGLGYLGAEVYGFSLPLEYAKQPTLFQLLKLEQRVASYYGDIADLRLTQDVYYAAQPDIIFHLAAQSLVSEAYHFPFKTIQTNALGTVALLESIRQAKKPVILVNVTTDKCYLNKEQGKAFIETDELGGEEPYSVSKAASEWFTQMYRQCYLNTESHIRVAQARGGNVIGGGDFAKDRIIPDIIRAIQEQSVLTLRAPMAIRPWQYVLDVLMGYMQLAQHIANKPAEQGAYNFGPTCKETKGYTVEALVQQFIQQISAQNIKIKVEPTVLKEAKTLRLNNQKSKTILDWQPVYDFATLITDTAKWYQLYLTSPDKLQAFSEEQWDNYFSWQAKRRKAI